MFLAAKKHTIRQTSRQNQEKSVSHLWKTARSPTTIIRSPGFSVSCKGVFAIDGLTTTIRSAATTIGSATTAIGSAATTIRGAAIIHAIDIGLLQARCDAHLARHQVARGQTVHADGAHVLSHLPLGSRLRTTAVDGSSEYTQVVNLLIAIVSKMYFLLTFCFFKSSKYGVIFIHGPLWAQIRDSRGMIFSRSLTSGVKPFYLSAHDCPVIAEGSVNKCNDDD